MNHINSNCGCNTQCNCNENMNLYKDVIDNECCIDDVGEMVQKLVRVFQLFERDQIKVHGFTTSQCYALLEINKSGSLTMSELSDKMNLNTSTMTRVLDNLVRDNYVSRDRAESDRRIVVINLTDKGKDAASTLNRSVNDYYKKILENIPNGQFNEILKSIGTLLNAFEKANPNCC